MKSIQTVEGFCFWVWRLQWWLVKVLDCRPRDGSKVRIPQLSPLDHTQKQGNTHSLSLWMVLEKSDGTESEENKMHADGNETKTPEKKQLPLNLKSETMPAEQVSKHWLLGVTVDEQLKWQTHINNIFRTRIAIFKMSFSFSGSLAWNSLAPHLRYPMELKTFKRKVFQPPRQTTWHKMNRILLLFSLACSCKVLYLYFIKF